MKFEIKGLEEMQRSLRELGDALKELNGPIAQLRFNPKDEASIQRAIEEMEMAVDAKTARFSSNGAVRDVVSKLKQRLAEGIRERARQAVAAGQSEASALEPEPE